MLPVFLLISKKVSFLLEGAV